MSKGNALSGAGSAYLRAARRQPVHWQQWGAEAFAQAQRENKPVLLHIGATWCHWCRVMDRESFENSETADLLNEHFIAIRVDRDERPDVDARYQSAVEAITGQGGWPLNVFLTPAGRPFFGGGYFPPEDRYDRAGFPRVLLTMAGAFLGSRDDVEETAESLFASLAANDERPHSASKPTPALFATLVQACIQQFDVRHGGFGTQPKFPHCGALELLLLEAASDGTLAAEAERVALISLRSMATGGVHDQLGGGFHRFSTDDRWIVPRFEKMAYENAELLKLYVHAFRRCGEKVLEQAARGVMRWMDEHLSDRDRGGFYASQRADAALGDDGSYYTWTRAEARAVLSEPEFTVAALWFNLRDIGDMHSNPQKNVLHRGITIQEIAARLTLSEAAVLELLASAHARMLDARNQRPMPAIDGALYTGWNAGCISAYLEAARVLDDPDARSFALRSLKRVLAEAWNDESGLTHVVAFEHTEELASGGRIPGMLEDYALLATSSLDAWETTGELAHQQMAGVLVQQMLTRFYDKKVGGFYDTDTMAHPSETFGLLELRRKPVQDAPTPSGNAKAVAVLLRLHAVTGREELRAAAEKTLSLFSEAVQHLGLQAASYGVGLRCWLAVPSADSSTNS